MIYIDGSHGEGGGQVLRTSLALSLVTGQPFRIDHIRAGREKPGLMRQHLTAVRAAAEIGGASVEGAAIGSQALAFRPRAVRPGTYHFAVGTAGSATLVLQTILPALLTAPEPSELTLEGGTHNPWAPPFDFLQKSFLPLVERMGPRVAASLDRYGFYPAGGGRFHVRVEPAERLVPIDLTERGEVRSRSARAIVANLSKRIAKRELNAVAKKMNWDEDCFRAEEVEAACPGNVLLVEIESEAATEVFAGFGRVGVRAEAVARSAVEEVRTYLASGVPVGRYLADQLMVPFVLAGGGAFCTLPLSRHARTNIDVIRRFVPEEIRVAEEEDGGVKVRVGGADDAS
ncbi:MAG: RNA 3'-terminal phosphate cyclase [Bacteroidota bacterium]